MPYAKTKEGSLVNEVTLGDGYPLSNDLQPLKIGGEASILEISSPLPDGSDNGQIKVNGDLDITGTLKTKLSHDLIYDFNDEVNTLAQAKVDALIDSAPAALDTLNELAAALGDDASFATTVTNSIATKLNLSGGTLTGDLTINSPESKLIFRGDDTSMNHEIESDGHLYITVDDDADDSNNFVQFRANSGGTIKNLMRIQDDGKVGIGVTNPDSRLEIIGEGTSNTGYGLFVKDSNDDSLFYVRNDGVVSVTGGYFFAQHSNGAYFTGSIKARGGVTDDGGTLGLGGGGNLDHLNILSGGNVGIGTASPSTLLHLHKEMSNNADNSLMTIQGDLASGDLGTEKVLIDFTMTDANANNYPQVKIGAAVGQNSDADSLSKEGSGAFVVYTSAGTSDTDAEDNTAERMRVDYQGNVGIGTTSPSVKLHVDSSTSDTVAIFKSSDSTARIQIQDDDTTNHIVSNNSTLSLGANNTTHAGNLNIDSSGKVGIGNTSPNHLLHVGDDVAAGFTTTPDKAIQLSSSTNDHEIAYILYAGEGTNNIRSKYYVDDATKYVGWDSTHSTGWLGYEWKIAGSQSMTLDTSGNLELSGNLKASNLYSTENIYHTDDTHTRIQMLADRFLIYAGDVEVLDYQEDGTSTLEIDNSGVADITFGGGNVFFGGSQGSSDAKVGIGTTSPQADLHINSANSTALYITASDSNPANAAAIRFAEQADGANNYFELDYNGNLNTLAFHSNNQGDMFTLDRSNNRIYTGTANVGIGTSSPQSALHVEEGDIRIDAAASGNVALRFSEVNNTRAQIQYKSFSEELNFITDDASGSDVTRMTIKSEQDATAIGIGTTNPQALLHLTGTGGATSGITFTNAHEDVDMYFTDNNDNSDFVITYVGTGGAEITLEQSGDLILNGTNGDNVGIGTASPTTKLDVEGSVSYKHISLTADSDDLDVSDCTVVECTPSGTDRLGGLTGGVQGQVIHVLKVDSGFGRLIIEHNEGTGNQDIFLSGAADITLTARGGITLYCNGTSWFALDK